MLKRQSASWSSSSDLTNDWEKQTTNRIDAAGHHQNISMDRRLEMILANIEGKDLKFKTIK